MIFGGAGLRQQGSDRLLHAGAGPGPGTLRFSTVTVFLLWSFSAKMENGKCLARKRSADSQPRPDDVGPAS